MLGGCALGVLEGVGCFYCFCSAARVVGCCGDDGGGGEDGGV